MTDRERLIDLMIEAKRTDPETGSFTEYLADYLLEHGVIVLPCNVGDTVYHVYPKKGIQTNAVRQIRIGSCGMYIFDFNGFFEPSDFGKTVFLTREEAEKALKERDGS